MADTTSSRKPRVVIIAAIAFIAVVAIVVAVVLINRSNSEPASEPERPDPITTTLPAPTPQGEPIELSGDTELSQALPVVLDHVLTAQSRDAEAFVHHRALEGWHLTYSAPGSDIDVYVLQWETRAQANEFFEGGIWGPNAFADGDGRRSGDVAVEGESVGLYEIGVLTEFEEPSDPSTPASEEDLAQAPQELGPGVALWTNGTVAFVATGDAARLSQFYDHFPY